MSSKWMLIQNWRAPASIVRSSFFTQSFFEEICRDAAGDAGIAVRVLAPLTQGSDHPVLLNVPESRYLTGLLLQVL